MHLYFPGLQLCPSTKDLSAQIHGQVNIEKNQEEKENHSKIHWIIPFQVMHKDQ